ncbi:DnaK suppressor protein [Duganella rhizosphaerae]|uniref:TraR/DksA family transcriptional regulator n=1 Tax=Duganella rhizosphaerae TaxID=2885763 RepID=UPI0030E8146A
MSPLFPATLHILGERLQQRREQLASQLRQRLHQNHEQQEMALFNNYAVDLDRAEACQLSDTDIALLNHELAELRTVDEALARLREGVYGLCAHCGEAIGEARLLAQPEAVMCRDCQAEAEQHGDSRPATAAGRY